MPHLEDGLITRTLEAVGFETLSAWAEAAGVGDSLLRAIRKGARRCTPAVAAKFASVTPATAGISAAMVPSILAPKGRR